MNFFSSNNGVTICLKNRYNLQALYTALQELGDFDKTIEVDICNETYFKFSLKAVDKQGTTFIFEGMGNDKKDEILLSTDNKKETEAFSFYRKSALSKTMICKAKILEPLGKEYLLIRDLDAKDNSCRKYTIKKDNIEYSFVITPMKNFDEEMFKKIILENKELDFIKFIGIVKQCLPDLEENPRHMNFSLVKGFARIGIAIFKDNIVTTFYLEEEDKENKLLLLFSNGELTSTLKTTKKIDNDTISGEYKDLIEGAKQICLKRSI